MTPSLCPIVPSGTVFRALDSYAVEGGFLVASYLVTLPVLVRGSLPGGLSLSPMLCGEEAETGEPYATTEPSMTNRRLELHDAPGNFTPLRGGQWTRVIWPWPGRRFLAGSSPRAPSGGFLSGTAPSLTLHLRFLSNAKPRPGTLRRSGSFWWQVNRFRCGRSVAPRVKFKDSRPWSCGCTGARRRKRDALTLKRPERGNQ